jgi:hypothetical protein
LLNYISPDIKSFLDGLQNISLARFNMSQANCHAIVDAAKKNAEAHNLPGMISDIANYTVDISGLKEAQILGIPLTQVTNLDYETEQSKKIKEEADKKTPIVERDYEGKIRVVKNVSTGADDFDNTGEMLKTVRVNGIPLAEEYKKTLASYLGTNIMVKLPSQKEGESTYKTAKTVYPVLTPQDIYLKLKDQYTAGIKEIVEGTLAGNVSQDILAIRQAFRERGFPAAIANMNNRILQGLRYLKRDSSSKYEDTVRYLASSCAKLRVVEFLFEALDIVNTASNAEYMDQIIRDLWQKKKLDIQNDLDIELSRYDVAAKSFVYTSTILEQMANQKQVAAYYEQVDSAVPSERRPIMIPAETTPGIPQ